MKTIVSPDGVQQAHGDALIDGDYVTINNTLFHCPPFLVTPTNPPSQWATWNGIGWDDHDAPIPEKSREDQKAERAAAVETIKVTTSAGNVFDGDEVSQGRMVRAIMVLNATGQPFCPWVLADNSSIPASANELTEALALAGAAQAALWVLE